MKVLLLHPIQDTHPGSTKALLNIVEQLTARGVEIEVAAPGRGALTEELKTMGVKQVEIKFCFALLWQKFSLFQLLLLLRRYVINLFAGIRLACIVRRHHIDLIHSNVCVEDIGYIASRLTGIPHIYHIREYLDLDFNWKHYLGKKNFMGRLWKHKQYNICITKDIQTYNGQKSNPHSRVIYDGVCPAGIGRFIPAKEPYFLYTGRLQYGKGIESVLQQYIAYCRTYPDDNVRLKIAGDTNDVEYRTRVHRMIVDAAIADRVDWLGMRSDIYDLMAHALAEIVPSHFEGFGFITAEAMFNGCLVIGRNIGGTKEQFDNGLELTGEEIGIRFEKDEELPAIMHAVVQNGIAYYEPMILRSQKVVRQLYTSERNAEQIYQFYQDIILRNPPTM